MNKIPNIATSPFGNRYFKRQQVLIFGAVAAAALACGSASAASPDTGWYGTANLGRSSIDTSVDNVFTNQGVTSASVVDKHDTMYSLGVGYQFNQNFALEGGYNDFGKFNVNSTISAPAADTGHGQYKASGWNLTGVGIIPLNNGFAVYGKAGLILADVKLDAASDTGVVPIMGGSKTSTNGTYGLGASYNFSRNLMGRLEWNRYQDIGNSSSSGKVDLNAYTVGVALRF